MRSHLLHPFPTTTTTTATTSLFHTSSSSPSRSGSTNLLRFSWRPSAGALPRRDSNAEPVPGGRSAFGLGSEFDDDYDADGGGGGGGGGFGFDGARKQRVWWSGYDDDEGDDGLGFDGDEEFWGFKVLRAFGWMFPAIAISLLLGTGPNAFIMASAVPLGQTLLSLAFEKVWGETGKRDSWKPRTRAKTKKRPFVNPRSEGRKSGGKRENGSANGRNAYQSWATMDGSYSKAGSRDRPRFGGWDELDEKAGTREVPKSERSRKPYVPSKQSKQSKKGKFSRIGRVRKFSRIGRVRETPLLVRLLIAAFPFLGFWTKLFF